MPVANLRAGVTVLPLMGLADRQYMKDRGGRGSLAVSTLLMIGLVVVFALQCINDVYIESFVESYLALTPFALSRGWLWQLLTFQVLHVDLLHILCNLLGLWFFGQFVESVVGPRRLLLAFFGCGLVGGLLQVVLMSLFPHHFAPVVFGASAGTGALFAIFARLESESEVRWNFLIPIRAQTLLWVSMAISLFFTLVPSGRGGMVAHAAHLGGMLAGIAFVRLGWHQDFRPLPWVDAWQRVRAVLQTSAARNAPKRPLAKVTANRAGQWLRPAPEEQELPPGEFISREVDPILDKISQHGIHSLTDREKKILEKARERMAKR